MASVLFTLPSNKISNSAHALYTKYHQFIQTLSKIKFTTSFPSWTKRRIKLFTVCTICSVMLLGPIARTKKCTRNQNFDQHKSCDGRTSVLKWAARLLEHKLAHLFINHSNSLTWRKQGQVEWMRAVSDYELVLENENLCNGSTSPANDITSNQYSIVWRGVLLLGNQHSPPPPTKGWRR